MLNNAAEKTLTRVLGVGAFATSIFILWGVVTDPVNATKHFMLGATAVAAMLLALVSGFNILWRDTKTAIILGVVFLIFTLNAVINSESPLPQNLFGTYGRNTGFMAYLFLSFIFLSALALRTRKSFEFIVKALILTGIVNVIYSLWALLVGDFVGWTNPYNAILGTFGNPNFIGAFLGIFVSVLIAYLLSFEDNLKVRIILGIIVLVTLYEIEKSNAIQGIVVSAGGIALVLLFFIRSKFKSIYPVFFYVIFIVISGLGRTSKRPTYRFDL